MPHDRIIVGHNVRFDLGFLEEALGQPGKFADSTRYDTLAIARDAEPGERELRILNAGGVSNRFRFMVGELPEIMDVEPNSEKSAPQKIASLPVTVLRGATQVVADAMEYDNLARVLQLKGRIRAVFTPPVPGAKVGAAP